MLGANSKRTLPNCLWLCKPQGLDIIVMVDQAHIFISASSKKKRKKVKELQGNKQDQYPFKIKNILDPNQQSILPPVAWILLTRINKLLWKTEFLHWKKFTWPVQIRVPTLLTLTILMGLMSMLCLVCPLRKGGSSSTSSISRSSSKIPPKRRISQKQEKSDQPFSSKGLISIGASNHYQIWLPKSKGQKCK